MTVRRLFAIAGIFLGTSAAWAILGTSLVARTGEFDSRLEQEVHALWGAPQRQLAASATLLRAAIDTEVVESKGADGKVTRTETRKDVMRPHTLAPESTRATADVQLEHRQKGLLWYATYEVRFRATYRFRNPDGEPRPLTLRLPLPEGQVLFDDVTVAVERPAGGRRRACRVGTGRVDRGRARGRRHLRGRLPVARRRHLDLCVRALGRRPGARLRAGPHHQRPRGRLSGRVDLAGAAHGAALGLGADLDLRQPGDRTGASASACPSA